ncbi:uncharacterized protein SPPG_06372 [Spizellomyces punctatus DAOM BR117]|uniref:Uncharacterized protein n=1 Tax=Spizellomyces punctatus (strain DAOM BR117) TaxID=645134 RepID=A0A0L0HCK8_SPIPD|nr:uncharacterized protein SPPG_06372 [Spizellomyces punctatus DAOM BR117]KNC98691.1 hypothetical protein SPPG_06372 [Spizellomyces punctatus DAOM BR117]|eukprot:XP_016606731.1 hypothetical protein SPPG_06372 [Spizellomyces punctatus DAOM BR117]
MEERVRQYHVEATSFVSAAVLPPKALKAMNGLRKFIHKNQDYRFSDKEKAKLFGAVEAYFTIFDRNSDRTNTNESDANKPTSLPLIEDALKVPLFTTKQKSTMLKWYDELHKEEGGHNTQSRETDGTARHPWSEEDDWGNPDEWGTEEQSDGDGIEKKDTEKEIPQVQQDSNTKMKLKNKKR